VDFRWNEWNIEDLAAHGVSPDEAEVVVRAARRPYPRKVEEDKWLVWGRGRGGRFLQVVFVLEDEGSAFIIHARPLTDREKPRLRRRPK
jgi:uncharacterized DUF497 family protein